MNKYQEQIALIEHSEKYNVPFSAVLKEKGWSYDDLVYHNSFSRNYPKCAPRSLDDFNLKKNSIPIVSFFSGCGGLDLGFEAAGYEHVCCFELNELFCKTMRKNKKWKVYGPPFASGDVSNTEEVSDLLKNEVHSLFEGVFIGGPPCQPFSIAANQRFSKDGNNFKRVGFSHEKNGNLFFNYIELIKKFKPKVFLVENVPGLKEIDGGKQLKEAIDGLKASGYDFIEHYKVDASDYCVPQQRIRLIIIGVRGKGQFSMPAPTAEKVCCSAVLQGVSDSLLQNNEKRMHNAASIKRYAELDYGQRDQLGRVDRLDPTVPSKTVIAGGTNGGGRSHLHPEIPRTLSVRECARLQSFPDDYVFVGPTARQFTQVGNAVPPILAAQIATSILKVFRHSL